MAGVGGGEQEAAVEAPGSLEEHCPWTMKYVWIMSSPDFFRVDHGFLPWCIIKVLVRLISFTLNSGFLNVLELYSGFSCNFQAVRKSHMICLLSLRCSGVGR